MLAKLVILFSVFLTSSAQNYTGDLFPPDNLIPASECTYETNQSRKLRIHILGDNPRNPFNFYLAGEDVRLDKNETSRIRYLTTPRGSRGTIRYATRYLIPSLPIPVRAVCISFLFQIGGERTSLAIYEYPESTKAGKLVWRTVGEAASRGQWRQHTTQITSNQSVKIELVAETTGGSSFVSLDDLTVHNATCTIMDGDTLKLVNYPLSSRRLLISEQWRGGIVPFTIVPGFDEQQVLKIKAFIAELSFRSCISFRPRQPLDEDYVEFVKVNSGCISDLGRLGDKQRIRLSDDCFTKSILTHTILHILGLRHEHIRPDRNRFVNVLWDNIPSDKRSMFDILTSFDRRFMSVAYDKKSVMHFGNTELSKGRGLSSLQSISDPNERLGPEDEDGPTAQDYQKLANVYCAGTTPRPRILASTPASPIRTTINPQDNIPCQSLSEVPTSAKRGSISSYERTVDGLYRNSELCAWTLQVVGRKVIQFDVQFLDIEISNGCEKDSITIFDGPRDSFPVLFQACGTRRPIGSIISTTNQVMVLFVTDASRAGSGFKIDWVEVDRNATAEFAGEGSLSPVDCSFENSACGWANTNNAFLWKRKPLAGILDHTSAGAYNGSYVAIDASSISGRRNVAGLRSKRIKTSDGFQCFSFWYQMVDGNDDAGTLDLFMTTDTGSADRKLWSSDQDLNQDPYQSWVQVLVPLSSADSVVYSLQFNATLPSKKPNSGIVIDDISISPESCDESLLADVVPSTTTPMPVNGFTCNFESGNCLWRGSNWQTKSGKSTQGSKFGALNDRTRADSSGKYLVLNSLGDSLPKSARIEASVPANAGYKCFSIFYLMNGLTLGNLSIKAISTQRGEMVLFEASGNKDQTWQRAVVGLAGLTDAFQIRVEAQVTGEAEGDVAVDDFLMTTSSCWTLTSDDVARLAASSIRYQCDFEGGDLCASSVEFFIPPMDPNFRWQSSTGTMNAMYDKTSNSLEGNIVVVNNGRKGRRSVLQSKFFRSNEANCLNFWYNFGQDTPDDASLTVLMAVRDRVDVTLLTISASASHRSKWVQPQVSIPESSGLDFAIKFVALSGGTGTQIALDDISLSSGSNCMNIDPAINVVEGQQGLANRKPSPIAGLTCNFTISFCDWQPVGGWKLNSFSRLAHVTSGYLISDSYSPNRPSSYLNSGLITGIRVGCLRFVYDINGWFRDQPFDTLNVLVLSSSDRSNYRLVASYSGSMARASPSIWNEAKITLFEVEDFFISFEAKNGDSYSATIAISEISLRNNVCT